MEVCKQITPVYREVEPGHQVACHLYDDEIMKTLNKRLTAMILL